MPDDRSGAENALGRRKSAFAILLYLAVCLSPYAFRLRTPSLYADDIVRVAELQNSAPFSTLFRPFNEHMAPLFEVVSWLTWLSAGRTLANAPLAFTLASFLPFLLTLWLLGRAVRRETGSETAPLVCLAAFSLSWLAVETVYWYSASSFMWALAATLVAWRSAGDLELGGGWKAGVRAALATAAAPAFSGIGLLAGPLAAVRVVAGTGGRKSRPAGRLIAATAPVAGTVLYLVVCSAFRYHAVLAANLGQKAGIAQGFKAAFVAPVWSLLPALAGVRLAAPGTLPAAAAVALTAAVAAWLVARSWRGENRPLVLGGLLLVLGGYAMAYCARAGDPGQSLLETQRYHLFPMLGLVFLLAAGSRNALRRWDARPAVAVRAATVIGAVLLVLHAREMRGRALFLRYPDQVQTLRAIDRLGSICLGAGVSRAQALACLDPVETAWTPAGVNILTMLPPSARTPTLPDALVRPTLLAALTPTQRASVCGGMDVSPYLSADRRGYSSGDAVGRPVKLFRVRAAGEGYEAEGWPSYVEFAFPDDTPPDARTLSLSGLRRGDLVELWWRGEGGRWSETRSVRFRAPEGDALRLPLERLPHWRSADVRRIRLLFHSPGMVATAGPRLVR